MAFTTAQKREVIQRHYPTANNIAVKGNVFFAVFPDAEPIIGWLHSPTRSPSSAGSTPRAERCGSRPLSP